MTGNGTQADPYKPTTWEEVLSCTANDGIYTDFPVTLVKTSDTQVKSFKVYLRQDGSVVKNPKTSEISTYYENKFVFDMNDYYPEGITETIQLRGFISGNGATIKNAYYRGNTACFEVGAAKKTALNFVNCRGELSGGFFIGSNSSLQSGSAMFEQCQFSGTVTAIGSSTPYFSWIGRYAYFSRCSFTVELEGAMLDYALYKCCNINAIITGAGSGYLQLDNSYLAGRIEHLQMQRISSDYFVGDSVINCESNRITWGGGSTAHLLINRDKLAEGISIPSAFTQVTTAQLKDAEYLSSIGFPIQT